MWSVSWIELVQHRVQWRAVVKLNFWTGTGHWPIPWRKIYILLSIPPYPLPFLGQRCFHTIHKVTKGKHCWGGMLHNGATFLCLMSQNSVFFFFFCLTRIRCRIRTCDPSVRAAEDSTCLRPRGHWDQRIWTLRLEIMLSWLGMGPEFWISIFRQPLLVVNRMKFSRAISRIKWLSGEQTNVSKTVFVLVFRVLVWQTEPADSPRELHHTQSPGKQQISLLDVKL
jgi:hypothetical protein